jgi:GntR family transcriptional regulator
VLPFAVRFKSGSPVHEQVLLAVRRAIVGGRLVPGDRFPSVRTLSQELRISPATAHKIISTLTEEGVLSIEPGVGAIIRQKRPTTAEQREALLEEEVERLVVGARLVALKLEDVLRAVRRAWNRLVKE